MCVSSSVPSSVFASAYELCSYLYSSSSCSSSYVVSCSCACFVVLCFVCICLVVVLFSLRLVLRLCLLPSRCCPIVLHILRMFLLVYAASSYVSYTSSCSSSAS